MQNLARLAEQRPQGKEKDAMAERNAVQDMDIFATKC